MQIRAVLSILTLLLALSAGPAMAAGKARPFIPPPSAADLGLRGPVGAAAIVAATPPQRFASALPTPGLAYTGLSAGGLGSAAAFTPLKPIGDQAPMCRAACAQTRVMCDSREDGDCGSNWSQCVVSCSGSALAPYQRN